MGTDEDRELIVNNGNFSIAPLSPMSFRLMGEGRILLEIRPDGTVVGEIEDAGEAAKVFVQAVRHQFEAMFLSDRAKLEEALIAARPFVNNLRSVHGDSSADVAWTKIDEALNRSTDRAT